MDNPTTPTPVAVFSFGPDTDEGLYGDYQYLTGEDVFTTYSLPMAPYQLVFPLSGIPQPARPAPSPPPPPPGFPIRVAPGMMPPGLSRFNPRFPARLANMTGIYRGYPGQVSGGEYLQPPYDPTNGITSKGNLYLIFPRP
jgi:hypothetical protein